VALGMRARLANGKAPQTNTHVVPYDIEAYGANTITRSIRTQIENIKKVAKLTQQHKTVLDWQINISWNLM
jgi:hypothetical protein